MSPRAERLVRLEIDAEGRIATLTTGAAPEGQRVGTLLPAPRFAASIIACSAPESFFFFAPGIYLTMTWGARRAAE